MTSYIVFLYIAKDWELKSYASPYRDGVPPYRYRKPHRHEIHESAKVNGRVPLPHIPVSLLWISRTPCWLLCVSLPFFPSFLSLFLFPHSFFYFILCALSPSIIFWSFPVILTLSFLPPALSLPSPLKWMCILKMHSGGWGALIMCRWIADGEWESASVLSKAFLMLSSALLALPQQMWSPPSLMARLSHCTGSSIIGASEIEPNLTEQTYTSPHRGLSLIL